MRHQRGQVLFEVLVAVAIFALIAGAFTSISLASVSSVSQSSQELLANDYLQQGYEAVRAIRDRGFNNLIYQQSGVYIVSGQWELKGEGSIDIDLPFTRTITFEAVYRDSSGNIINPGAPGAIFDPHTKAVKINVNWDNYQGENREIEKYFYLTNWKSQDWAQSDWVGSSGQEIWSDPAKYYASSAIDDFATGEIKLIRTASFEWPFDVPANYSYDTEKIVVEDSAASLKVVDNGDRGSINAIIDTLEFDPADGETPEIIQVSGNIYAIVYQGKDGDGYLKTVEVANNGQITDTVIDTYEFDINNCQHPDIIHMSGNIFAISYEGVANKGYVKTISIADNGQITKTVIDIIEIEDFESSDYKIINVNSTMMAIAYEGPSSDGFVATIEILANGQISDMKIDFLEFDTEDGATPDIIQVSSNVFAIAFKGKNSDGFVKTVQIASNGQITDTVIDTLEFDTSDCAMPEIIKISGDIYAVAYSGEGNDGYVKTISIAANGQISASVIDTLEFDPLKALRPDITTVSDNIYAISYEDNSAKGKLVTIRIFADGQIQDTIIDSDFFDAASGQSPYLINIFNEVYGVVYQGVDGDGFLKTFSLESALYAADKPTIQPIASAATDNIIEWLSFAETATKDGGEIYYQLSDDDGATWYYWNGSGWAAAGANDYNTAATINNNINQFFTANQKIIFKAFLSSDGFQQVSLGHIEIAYRGGSEGTSFASLGSLESSAFNTGSPSVFNAIEWTETLPDGPDFDIKFQIKTAPDNSGAPGEWSATWCGPDGEDGDETDFFSSSAGQLVNPDHNGDQWVKYKVFLISDGTATPILQDMTVNYAPYY